MPYFNIVAETNENTVVTTYRYEVRDTIVDYDIEEALVMQKEIPAYEYEVSQIL